MEEKCNGKKILMKSGREEKMKEHKNSVKSHSMFLFTILNKFYLFIYFSSI